MPASHYPARTERTLHHLCGSLVIIVHDERLIINELVLICLFLKSMDF